MSTFTKEWLQNTITSIESARDEMPFGLDNDQAHMLTAFKIALASLEREQIRHEHAKWSDSTFGCVGPIGPLKHLSKRHWKPQPNQTILASGLICSFCCGMHSAVLVSVMLKLPLLWKIN